MRRAAVAALRLTSLCSEPSAVLFGSSQTLGASALPLLRHATASLAGPGAWPTLTGTCSFPRLFSTNVDVTKEVDTVNELFAAARDEIEYAKEEAETVYFNESVQAAKKAVDDCLGRWEALLAALPEEERARVVRSMGLKIAQLQAEYDEVSKLHLED